MARTILGFDIGSARMKIAEFQNGQLLQYHTEDIPDNMMQDGSIMAWDAMVDYIRNTVRKNGFSGKYVNLVIPDSESYIRRITMPLMTEAQLMVNLPYEFHDMINGDKSEYVFDYSMIEVRKNEDGNGGDMDLFGAAIPKELINRYSDLFRRAGLKLVKAAPRDMAVTALMHRLDPEFMKHDSALLDLGYIYTTLDIYRNGYFETKNSIELGVRNITDAAANQLGRDRHIAFEYMKADKDNILSNDSLRSIYNDVAVNVSRSLNYYSFQNRDNSLERMYYFGGGSRITPFVEAISQNVNLNTLPLSSLGVFPEEALMDGPAAVGICLE